MAVDRRTCQSHHKSQPGSCAIVVMIDKKEHGFYVTYLNILERRKDSERREREDRTWRTSAPKLDPWYMFPIRSRCDWFETPEHAFDLYNGVMST